MEFLFEQLKVFHTNKKKVENNAKKNKKGVNNPSNKPELAPPKGIIFLLFE